MPPKIKLHQKSGKIKNVQNCSESPVDNVSSENTSAETNQQFELELCWCIQQLQRTLGSGKLNQKQVQENTKVLNTLMSNTSSFIKKRQVMRLTFGDYRTKMMEEEKKLSKAVNMKICPSSPSKNSKFMKKACLSKPEHTLNSTEHKENCSDPGIAHSDNNFKFNFSIENIGGTLLDNLSITETQKCESDNSRVFVFPKSDNSFRFNFTVNESDILDK